MPRPLQFLDLFPRETAESPPPESRWVWRKPQVWIALCLPNLPLESQPGYLSTPGYLSNEFASTEPSSDESAPAAVVEPQQGQMRIVAVNAHALHYGVEPGHKLSAALALAATLKVYERSPAAELGSLELLAAMLQAITPMVSIAPPESLLLEVSGSLKLFGSLAAIKARLHAEVGKRRLAVQLSAAPTATAALWLARCAAADVGVLDELPARLGALPLTVTRWPESVRALLHDLGIRSIGDCLRLPRDGFARRVGAAYLRELDLAVGRQFDLRAEFATPVRWKSALDLHEESSDCSIFMEAIELIIDRLTAELRRRQAQVQSLRVVFKHLHRPPTLEEFSLLEPTHERQRLLDLLRDRVERIVLPAPAIAIGFRTGPFRAMGSSAVGLFEKTPLEAAARTLFERLRGRFGLAAVHGMGLIAEHRPERAWAKIDCTSAERGRDQPPVPRHRPLWLLLAPLPLESPAARRYYDGSLQFRSGPERIESGWWDEQDVGRDYYVAVSSQGQRLWIYRDRKSREWHLHGLFG